MSKNKNYKKNITATKQTASQQQKAAANTTKKSKWQLKPAYAKITLFLLLYIFCTFIYGDVFARAEQESFINKEPETMKFLTDQSFGSLYLWGRWLLLIFKSKWIGGLFLSAILTACACQIDYIFRLPARWRSLSFLLPFGILGWMVIQGLNLYYKNEPSRIVLIPLFALLVLLVISLVVRFFRKKKEIPTGNALAGFALSCLFFVGLCAYALYTQQNTILVARMQQRLWEQDWEGMVKDGLSARRPSRPVAAYYAIGLLRQGQLIEGLFDIPYDYPYNYLEQHDGSEEYGILQADCDFEAGLVQPAYHYALEFTVMSGPTLYYLKRMAVSAIMLGRKELAEKYLRLIESCPFETAFVEKYRPMIANPKLIENDAELAEIKKLQPQESRFEQNYRQPIFLGYNLGLMQGSKETLTTSIAACLYSKSLGDALPRVEVLQQQGANIPLIVQQALACFSIKHPEIRKQFPISQHIDTELQSFLMDARPYIKDKDKLREVLKKDWLGTYMYYYYCENNDSIATGKAFKKNHGVN